MGTWNLVLGPQQIESKEVRSTDLDLISKEGTSVQVSGLKCVYFNARSVRSKVGELAAWVTTWDFDVVAISETWIEQGQEWLLQVPGFRCFSKLREGGKRGGGVALLVKDSITVVERY